MLTHMHVRTQVPAHTNIVTDYTKRNLHNLKRAASRHLRRTNFIDHDKINFRVKPFSNYTTIFKQQLDAEQ